jgi:hypothetical protein
VQDKNKIPMISSEIAGLWQSYIGDTVTSCLVKHFLNTVQDTDVKPHLQHALDMSQNHINTIKDFFNREGLPIPKGFTDEDVNLNAPPLYTDTFTLLYLAIMSRYAMGAYGLAYNNVARTEIRNYFSECIRTLMDMYENIADTLLNKGIFVKAPSVEVPKEVSFIKDNGFFDGILSKQRGIFTVEILHIFNNILTDNMARSLVTGFGQVANTKQVRDHMFNKLHTINDHIETFGKVLTKESIPVPSSSDMGVTDSTIPPFSDKLMMFHSTEMLGNIIIANYGAAIGSTLRADLVTNYIKFTAEISKHAKAGVDIMIENEWLEQPPQAVNHEKLLKV